MDLSLTSSTGCLTTTFTGQSGAGSLTNSTSGIATSQALNDFAGNLAKNVTNNLTGTVINTAINGKPLNEAAIAGALTSALITAGTAQAANSIGDATQSGALNTYTQAIAHAVAGCAGGAAAAGNSGCGAGAVGAVVGELTAQYASSSGMTDKTDITNLARLMSATAGLLVSNGDTSAVNVAASMGANAAQNNRMQHMNSFKTELAACQSNAGGNGCGTTLQMVQGTTPVSAGTNLNGYNAIANVSPTGTAMSYVITDVTGNQLIMQPLEYQNFQKMNPVQQQSLMNASQASLDLSSAGQYLSAGQMGAAASNASHVLSATSLGPTINAAVTATTTPNTSITNAVTYIPSVITPLTPDYLTLNASSLSVNGGIAVNAYDGTIYAGAGVAQGNPSSISWSPGFSASAGYIFGSNGASTTNKFLSGTTGQAIISLPVPSIGINLSGAVTKSTSGNTALEVGVSRLSPPSIAAGVQSYGTQLNNQQQGGK